MSGSIDAVDIINHVTLSVAVGTADTAITGAVAASRNKVLLLSSTNLFWNSGPSTVTATSADRYLPANTPMAVSLPRGHNHIGAIRDTADGKLSIIVIG